MSIHFISGKPGGGKSMYALKLVVEELVHGSRPIITNLPLRLPELAEYLQREFPDRVTSVAERVRLLSDEETAEFWCHRPGCRVARLEKKEWFEGKLPSYAGVRDSGVMYVIDEIHNYFGARQWALTGQDVLFYLSQHRKLGDTVVCVTQAVGNVDKQFRSVAQDFTYLRNLAKEQYGMFSLPAVFIRKTFGSVPTETSQPNESGTFRLDVRGLGSCYDSAQGVGIHGRGADKAEVPKGRSFVWFFVGLAVVVGVVFIVLPKVIARQFTPVLPGVTHIGASAVSVAPGVGGHVGVPPAAVLHPLPVVSVSNSVAEVGRGGEVEVTGWMVRPGGGGGWLTLSDGRTYRVPEDGEVGSVGKGGAIVGGKAYRWRH